MGIAILGISSLYKGIQHFMNAGAHLNDTQVSAPDSPGFKRPAPNRALRVLRISEQGDHPLSAGRMVISGRMADVCAELDRLIALENRALNTSHLLKH